MVHKSTLLQKGSGGSLTVTDGVNTVTGTTQITVENGTVGGSTPDATLAITSLSPKLGFVATGGVTQQNSNSTNKQFMGRSFHIATDNITQAKLIFANYTGQKEVAPGATATITASIEYPANTFTQVTFSSSTSGTIPNGGQITSDLMTLTMAIPDGALFWVRAYYTSTAGILYNVDGLTTSGYDSCVFGVSGISDLTVTSGTVGTSQIYTYKPLAIIGYTAKSSVLILGDSRAYGYQDTIDTTNNLGYERYVGRYYGYSSGAANGDQLAWFLSNGTNRAALAQYATQIISNYGINDFHVAGVSLATQIANVATFCALFNIPVYWTTLEPISSSSDNWATLVNQTTDSSNTKRVGFNDDLRTSQVSGIAGYIEIANCVESSQDSGLWAVNGTANYLTPDGIHSNQTGNYIYRDTGTNFITEGKAFLPIAGGFVNGSLQVKQLAVSGTLTAAAGTFSGVQTYNASGAASVAAAVFTGVPYNGGTGTTNFPLLMMQPTGATPTTQWGDTVYGTFIGINQTGLANSYDFINCVQYGYVQFRVDPFGNVDIGGQTYTGSLQVAGKCTAYNGVATEGWGVPAINGYGRATAQTAAAASVASYTVGAADGSFEVSANVLVTTSTLHNFTVTCAYTDEGGTSRVLTLQFSNLGGTFLTAIANAAGAVPYEGVAVRIRAKASTAITIQSAAGGTYTTVTYNIEGSIVQLA